MDFSGFDAPAFDTSSNTATVQSPQKSSGGGILGNLIRGITQAPSYFLKTDIINPGRELAAQATGNKQAYQNAVKAQQQTIGNNPGQAFKRLAGNTAQLAGTLIAPEVKGAGLLPRVTAAAKGGAVVGAGGSLANDQNVLKGAGEGALLGAVAPGVAKVVSRLLPGSVASDMAATGDTSVLDKIRANTNNHLQQMEASSGGFGAGTKLPGSGPEGISLEESQALSKLGQKYNIPAGDPNTRLRAIQGQLNTAGQQIDQALQTSNRSLSAADKQAIMDEFQSKVDQIPPVSGRGGDIQQIATQLKQHFMGQGQVVDDTGHVLTPAEMDKLGVSGGGPVSDLTSMNQYRRNLDNQINFNRNAQSPDPVSEQVATAMRNTLSDQLNKHVPEVASANKTYSELKALESPTLGEARRLSQNQSGGGFMGTGIHPLNNPIVRGAENRIATQGQKMTGGIAANQGENLAIGNEATGPTTATPNTPTPAPKPILGNLNNLATGGTAQRATVGGAVNLSQAAPNQPTDQSVVSPSSTGLSSSSIPQQTAPQGPQMSEQDLVGLIAADPTHASDYESLYKTLNASNGSTLDTTQKKELNSGEAAIGVLQNLGQQIQQLQQQGVAGNRVSGDIASLAGRLPLVAPKNAQAAVGYEKTLADTASQIATVLAGGKPSQSLINQIKESLPSLQDNPGTVQTKLNKLVSSVETVMRAQAMSPDQIATGLGQ